MAWRQEGQALVVALVLTTSACGIQPSGPPSPTGLRLRVSHRSCAQTERCDAPAHTHEGRLIFASRDSVVMYALKDRREFAFAVETISKLEVLRGHRGSLKAALRDAGKGALIGAAAGAVIGVSAVVMGSIFGTVRQPERVIAAPAAGFAVQGAAVGAVHGLTQGEAVWQEVTIRRLLQDLCRCSEPDDPWTQGTGGDELTVNPDSPLTDSR